VSSGSGCFAESGSARSGTRDPGQPRNSTIWCAVCRRFGPPPRSRESLVACGRPYSSGAMTNFEAVPKLVRNSSRLSRNSSYSSGAMTNFEAVPKLVVPKLVRNSSQPRERCAARSRDCHPSCQDVNIEPVPVSCPGFVAIDVYRRRRDCERAVARPPAVTGFAVSVMGCRLGCRPPGFSVLSRFLRFSVPVPPFCFCEQE